MTTTAGDSFEVQLAIYDLSRGMARNLSAQFLGPQFAIDIIPHTGIVAYGREYFFGAGIQSEEPHEFRRNTGMFPIQVQSLGLTRVNRADFEQWCIRMMSNGSYSAAAYDLLSRNCNNFSHDAATQGLQLPNGVPQWILGVPQRFLSSPMGQIVRPMLQNMQLTNVAGAQPVSMPSAPFANPTAPVLASTVPATKVDNPWANVSSSSPPGESQKEEVSILDTFSKPLLSSDTKSVSVCVKKLLATADPANRETLESTGERLVQTESSLDEAMADNIFRILLSYLESNSSVTFALMLLRVVLLRSPSSSSPAYNSCLDWIQEHISNNEGPLVQSPAARSMAWLCAANASSSLTNDRLEALCEVAVADVQHEAQSHAPVRQAASALLYNATLTATGVELELADLQVSMLCASLEGLADEPDATARLRRLMIVGRILKPLSSTSVNPLAQSLIQDLGLVDVLRQVSASGSGGADNKCRQLASEVMRLIDS